MRSARPAFLLVLATGALALPAAAQSGSANPHGELPRGLDCTACHSTGSWTELRSPLAFTHGEASGFVLEGAHQDTPCRGCHLDLRFDAPRVRQLECGACHGDVHDGRMVDACAACHDTRSFFDVDGELAHARTALPLTGAHRQFPCQGCHAQDRLFFTGLDPECTACHLEDFQASTVVDHEASGFSTDCTQCHSDLGWADSPAFDHVGASGGYGLEGAHAFVRCASCHQVPGMAPIYASQGPEDCIGCHQDEYDREHGAGTAFSTTCVQCHNQSGWGGAEFGHDEVTGYALLGRHARLECSRCHAVPGYQLLFPAPGEQDDCVACHQRDYDAEHGGEGYPTTCALCHSPDNWDARLSHDARFFPIFSGAHD
ncbi:MAG TPA: hypothetical protein VLA43_06705, partial [Longimicrobiales bacterium]|nr:hypothetical protein [Longimicrobiales bacterium]